MRKLASYIVEERKRFLQDMEMLKRELETHLPREDVSLAGTSKQDGVEKTTKIIYDFLVLDDDEIRKLILQKRLEAEFAMRIGHLDELIVKKKL